VQDILPSAHLQEMGVRWERPLHGKTESRAVIPIIIFLLFSEGAVCRLVNAVLFLLAAVTDTLDGYLARRKGMVTTLGKFLDPLADKLLMVTALIALIPAREIPVWMVIIIVGREIAVTGLRAIAAAQGMVIAAGSWGKYKTFLEVLSIFFLILDGEYFSIGFRDVGVALLGVAVIFAVISGVNYFKDFLKEIIA
jgi:CDP-diacylglycerol---glycerol-3-phosphate 3-phosphatidyltransferase